MPRPQIPMQNSPAHCSHLEIENSQRFATAFARDQTKLLQVLELLMAYSRVLLICSKFFILWSFQEMGCNMFIPSTLSLLIHLFLPSEAFQPPLVPEVS